MLKMKYIVVFFVSIAFFDCQNKKKDFVYNDPEVLFSDSVISNRNLKLDTLNTNKSSIINDKKPSQFRLNLDTIENMKCNIDVLGHVYLNMNELTTKDLDALLQTIDSSCNSNVEFLEFSNETLFKALELYPAEMLKLIETKGAQYDFPTIYKELTSPLHDLIPLDNVELALKGINLEGNKVDSVRRALQIAIDKQ
jgi:hypothetical protein